MNKREALFQDSSPTYYLIYNDLLIFIKPIHNRVNLVTVIIFQALLKFRHYIIDTVIRRFIDR